MVGTKIGNYRIVRLLGEGGMGRVYEAIQDQIERRAAIKVLHAQFAHNSEAFTRFLNEARAANIVQHPGVVNIYEFGQTEDGSPYIVMEFLDGEGLDKRIARLGRLSLSALRIARQIASALVAAHAKHIVHRDLKPSNVMLVPDPDMPGGERVKVVDFGIAKLAEHNTGSYQTRAGAILGTPAYMSPEQCRGAGEVTDKTDVYSMGVMLYEMLSGRPPFIADGEGEVMGMHLFQAPPPLHILEPTLPLDLVDLTHSMLAKDAAARPTIVEVARELDRIGQRYSGQTQLTPELIAIAREQKPAGPTTLPIDETGAVIAPQEQHIPKSGPQTPTLAGEKVAVLAPAAKAVTPPTETTGQQALPKKHARWPIWVGVAGLAAALVAGSIALTLTRRSHQVTSSQQANHGAVPQVIEAPQEKSVALPPQFGPPAEAAPSVQDAPDASRLSRDPGRSAAAPAKKVLQKKLRKTPPRERLELLD